MKGQSLKTVVLVASMLLAFEVASGASENDAGSFTDAGATPDAALRVHSLGPHSGNLTSGDAADWFRLKSRVLEAVCVEASIAAAPSVQASLVAVANDDSTREASGVVIFTGPATLGIASPSLRGALLNVSPTQPAQAGYQFSLGVLRASAQPPGDAGSGMDAPASSSGALPLRGGCTGGRLDGSAGDASDTFEIHGQSGSSIVVSLADTAGRASAVLTDGGGNTVAVLAPGSMSKVDLPSSSTYYLTITSSAPSPTSYVVGSCEPDCGPPSRPCRPMCAMVFGSDE